MKELVIGCGLILAVGVICGLIGAWLTAIDCPPGYVAVKGAAGGTVCVTGGYAP